MTTFCSRTARAFPARSVAVNQWLRELPASGCPSPGSWESYARVLKEWAEFLSEHGVGLFDSRDQLKLPLGKYAGYRAAGPVERRFAATTWGRHMSVLSLFTGVRGRQIAGRCVLVSTGPFPCQAEWASLLATLDAALRLHRHRPGTLPGLGKYLHQRTGGMIGSLSHLVRAAALTAVMDGTEEITRKLLDGIPVDHAAQSGARGVA